jgi:hypothetical protein
MVKGLNKFRDYFKDYPDSYIIIGGIACDLIIGAAGLTPRATKDIDIILVVEALSPAFVAQFWNFIKEGQYERTEKNEDERKYYRFLKPVSDDFPYQVELFSRVPDILDVEEGSRLTPIPFDDDLSSLSAILMNDDYYHDTRNHCTQEEGIQRANIEALICLKAKAYLDMVERKDKGEKVDEKHIKKHKADVSRLSAALAENNVFELPGSIQTDMQAFADAVKNNLPDKLVFKEMGIGNIDPNTLLEQLIQSFQLKKVDGFLTGHKW